MVYQEIEPGVWKAEKAGDFIEGVLIAIRPEMGINRSVGYYLENNQIQTLVWGSTVLDDRMQYVKVGEKVRITFKGKALNKKGQSVKIFKVEVDRS